MSGTGSKRQGPARTYRYAVRCTLVFLACAMHVGAGGRAAGARSLAPAANQHADGGRTSGAIPGDCDNNGMLDLADLAGLLSVAQGPGCPGAGLCRCYDLNGDGCVDMLDVAAFQVAFGSAQDASGPPPSNIFVLQLADYHAQCDARDGGDGVCHMGDPCCQTQAGPPGTPCDVLESLWVQGCDLNADGQRDRLAELNTLAEWNDFFWEPDDACNALARQHYPAGPTNKPYERHFIPMCTDGSTPPKGTTVCPDGQPIIQCTDGTRPVFYYHPGTVDRWIIKVQGGGITCFGGFAGDCWKDAARTDFSSAWSSNGPTKRFLGIFDIPDSHFWSYNLVVIDKCVGDRNYGSNTIPLQQFYSDNGTFMGEGPVYFHGFREVEALLAHLTTWDEPNKLTPNSQISMLTQSNGSNGLYMYLDRLAEFVRHDPSDGQPGLGLTDADVRGLASAYVRPSVEAENLVNNPSQDIFSWNDYAMSAFDDHINAPLSTEGLEGANGLWYSALTYYDGSEFNLTQAWGAALFGTGSPNSTNDMIGAVTLDESCVAGHGPNGGGQHTLEACLDSMHVLLNHVTTPVFLAPQLYDPVVRAAALLSYTRITDSFTTVGFTPDTGSLCGSHDENFPCSEQSQCPAGVDACDVQSTKRPDYHPLDFAVRVRSVARGAVNRSSGTPEETPADALAPVGHAVFAPERNTHSGWADPEKMDYRICDDDGAGGCAWQSAPLWAALKSWLELNATVICVERDLPGIDPNSPLTTWSETTPGPLLDNRCGIQP